MGIKQKQNDEPRQDPYEGRFMRAQSEIHSVLHSPFSGTLHEAMRIGNAAIMALNILDGTYDVEETSFKLTTETRQRD